MITGYYYIQIIRGVDATETSRLRNFPMDLNKLKLYKNVTTPLYFEVKRLDRKILRIENDKQYYFNIMSKDGQVSLLRKQFLPDDVEKGRFKLYITPEDIDMIGIDTYKFSITFVNSVSEERSIYLNGNGDTSSSVQILSDNLPFTRPPFVQFIFSNSRNYDNATDQFFSSRLPNRNSSNTLTLTMTNWTGTIQVQTTREMDPLDKRSWTTIDTLEFEENSEPEEIILSSDTAKYFRILGTVDRDNEGTFDQISYI